MLGTWRYCLCAEISFFLHWNVSDILYCTSKIKKGKADLQANK